MEGVGISEFTLRMILLFIPGIIGFYIYDCLIEHKSFKLYEKIIGFLIIGFLSYSLYYLIINTINTSANWICHTRVNQLCDTNLKFTFLDALRNEKVDLNFGEIIITSGLSIIVGSLITYCSYKKVLYTLANKRGISNKFGEIDLFNFLMNHNEYKKQWVLINDKENNLIYYCWILAWSRISEENELFLRDVIVYSYDKKELLYQTPAVYLPRSWENLTIEFPDLRYKRREG